MLLSPEPAETIEEIVVYGDKSLVQLRIEMYKAEDAFFDLFNSLNSDDEFDIRCRKDARTGSHIKNRVCEANYYRDLVGEATRESLIIGGPYIHPSAKIRQKEELLHKEVEALLVERPELLNVLSEAVNAKQVYDSERQKRCEGRIFICGR